MGGSGDGSASAARGELPAEGAQRPTCLQEGVVAAGSICMDGRAHSWKILALREGAWRGTRLTSDDMGRKLVLEPTEARSLRSELWPRALAELKELFRESCEHGEEPSSWASGRWEEGGQQQTLI